MILTKLIIIFVHQKLEKSFKINCFCQSIIQNVRFQRSYFNMLNKFNYQIELQLKFRCNLSSQLKYQNNTHYQKLNHELSLENNIFYQELNHEQSNRRK